MKTNVLENRAGTKDQDGNLVCYSFESKWEIVKEHLKIKPKQRQK